MTSQYEAISNKLNAGNIPEEENTLLKSIDKINKTFWTK